MNQTNDAPYLNHLPDIAEKDRQVLRSKERTYKGSWKKRGGIGAFMMLARKWDRIENMLETPQAICNTQEETQLLCTYDLFAILQHEKDTGAAGQDGSLLAEIRDLRRYLALVEAYYVHVNQPYPIPSKENPNPAKDNSDDPAFDQARSQIPAHSPEAVPFRFTKELFKEAQDNLIHK